MKIGKLTAIALAAMLVMGAALCVSAEEAEKRGAFRKNNFLDEMLEQNVVSQDAYDRITAYTKARAEELKGEFEERAEQIGSERKQNRPESGERPEFKGQGIDRLAWLDKLLEENVIDSAAHTAIKSAMENAEWQKGVNIFDKLVEDGVITKETSDAIAAYFKQSVGKIREKAEQNAGEAREKIRERFGNADGSAAPARTNMFDKMLEEKIITQDEYDAISAYMQSRAKNTAKE